MLVTAVVFLATTTNMPVVWGMVIGGLITTVLGL
jgi:hypothetical protein